MLTAIRQSDHQKVIGDYIPRDKAEKYSCAYCNKEVLHNKGLIKIGHFKHQKGESHCPNKGESLKHLQIKLAIYNYLKNGWESSFKILEVEKWLFKNAMRPDIYIETKKGNRIALEIQATPITVEQILARTSRYSRNNIYVCWILPYDYGRFHENKYDYKCDGEIQVPSKSIRLKEFELFLYYAYYKKLIFWDLDQDSARQFIVVELDEYFAEDVYLIKKGSGQFFKGRKAKSLKKINAINSNIGFEQFKLTNASPFNPGDKNYKIPGRKLFNYWL
jgi:competence CoiA-like predicted nuclease